MCNHIHKEHFIPKEKSGTAWKVFEVIDSKLTSMAAGVGYQAKSKFPPINKEWVAWDRKNIGDGFCIIPDFEEACRLLHRWGKNHRYHYCIVEVEYDNAMALQMEGNIFSSKEDPFEVMIVKKFRPIRTWEKWD